MRIEDVIAATCFILLHRACAYDDCEKSVSEKIASTINGIRFHLPIPSTWCDVPDEQVLTYRSVFDLIPKEKLTDVPIGSWATLCKYFSRDVAFVSKVLDLLKNDAQLVHFLHNITIAGFADGSCSRNNESFSLVRIMAQDLIDASVDAENAFKLLLANRALLLSIPSDFLFKLNDTDKTLLMYVAAAAGGAANTADAFWMRQTPLTRRSWSASLLHLMPNNRIVSFIKQQTDFKFFQILDTINMTELENVLAALHDYRTFDLEFLRSVNWNTVQIRKIVRFHFQQHLLNSSTIQFSYEYLSRLLPVQIAKSLAATTDATSVILDHLRNVNEISLPQALQLFECIITRLVEKFSAPSLPYCAWVAKLLYSQTNALVSRLYEYGDDSSKLNMTLVKCSDSDRYSLLQRHYIFGRYFGRYELQGDEIDRVLNVKGLLAAIPASFYIKLVRSSERRGSLESHFSHILKYFPARANKMTAFAAFHACILVTVPSNCIQSVLENNDNEILSTISPFHIRKHGLEIWHFLRKKAKNDQEFNRRIARFPRFVLTQLLAERQDLITYRQLFNETYPGTLLISGFSCEILSRIPSCEFLPTFQFYNEQRHLYNKEFPKDLQKCAQHAFLRYLRMKSNVSVAPFKADLLQYLDLADIRSIGGYVLATLPTTSFTKSKSKYGHHMVAEIGRLSLPELLLAVTGSHLVSITSQYLKDAARRTDGGSENDVRTEHLITLGNLTHFLDDKYVRRIDPYAFKFILEAEFIDTRICAPSSIRKIWANKLLEAFGSPATWDENTLLRIGDMLIVLDESSFKALNATTCSRAVDLMKSKYTRVVEWIPRSLPFYQVCSAILSPNERLAYQSSVQRLALFYAESIQLLLRTTVPVPERNISQVVLRIKRAAYPSSTSDLPSTNSSSSSSSTTDYSAGDDSDAQRIAPFTWSPVSSSSSSAGAGGTNERSEPKSAEAVYNENQIEIVPSAGAANIISETTNHSNADIRLRSSDRDTDHQPSETTTTSALRFVSPDTTTTAAAAAATAIAIATPTTTTTAAFSNVTKYRLSDSTLSSYTDTPHYSSSSSSSSTYDLSTRYSEMPTKANDVSSASTASPETTNFTAIDDLLTEHVPDLTSATFSASRTTSEVAIVGVATTITIGERNAAGSQSSRSPLADFNSTSALSYFMKQLSQRAKVTSTYRAKRQAAAAAAAAAEYTKSLNVSCNTLRILDTMSDLILNSPAVNFLETEAFDCIELFARMNNLTTNRRKTIWSRVASELSKENLTFLAGKVLSVVDERDFNNINLNIRSPGALELIGVLSQVLPPAAAADDGRSVRHLSRKILKDNEDLTEMENPLFPVLMRALGRFVCEMPEPMFSRLFQWLRKDEFAEWTVFDTLDDCPVKCLRQIANAAVAEYGDAFKWKPDIFTSLGPAAAAIPNVSSLIYKRASDNIIRYFSASALACLPSLADRLEDYRPYLDSIPLTAATLLLEKDCTPNYRDCPFTTSLAHVILTEDSFSLELKINSSESKSRARLCTSPSFLFLIFLTAVCRVVVSRISFRYAS